MREIKFRGKRTDNGEWVCGDFLQKNGKTYITPHPDREIEIFNKTTGHLITIFEVDPETVGQYTESKDKNGKEIYDGDLLLIAISSYSTGNVIAQKTVPVEYSVCKFGVPWSDDFTALDGFSNTTFEVIGNIYESPELLQQPTG